MRGVKSVAIPDRDSNEILVGKIAPQVMQRGILYYARAVLIEDSTSEVAAAWEHEATFRSKRNAWRIAKKIAKHMAIKLNAKMEERNED